MSYIPEKNKTDGFTRKNAISYLFVLTRENTCKICIRSNTKLKKSIHLNYAYTCVFSNRFF